MLKIISGIYKGQKIFLPSSTKTRPTTHLVREAVFDMIQFEIPKSIVLDLFAGSGAYGIESISRGATKVIFNDTSSDARRTIKKSLEKLKIRNYDLFSLDFKSLLASKKGAKFDIIFLDPPYRKSEYYNEALKLIKQYNLLSNLGHIILEKNNDIDIEIPKKFIVSKEKKYGSKSILIINNI